MNSLSQSRIRFQSLLIIVLLTFLGCTESENDNLLSLKGTWNCEFELYERYTHEGMMGYFSWDSEIVFKSNGEGMVYHGNGNPISESNEVEENFAWTLISSDSLRFESNNWSVTRDMYYMILEYNHDYLNLTGFDNQRNQWYAKLTRK